MRISILILAMLILSSSACTQTTKNYWKATKSYYYEYINKPATVDLEDMGIYSPGEGYLAETLPPAERVLERFKRTLFSLDKAPSDNWMYAFVNRFPWIEGVALVDREGTVIHRWPSVSLKEYDYSFIAEDTANPEVRHLIGHAEETALGPHVYVATQIMDMAEPAGHFVVHFDPRALFVHVHGSEEFMVAAPDALLWPGMFEAESTPVAGVDWADITRGKMSGRVSNQNGTFVWYCMMIGTMPMVFAAPDEGSFPEAPGQLAALTAFRGADSGEAISMAVMTEAQESEAGDMAVVAPPSKGVQGTSVAGTSVGERNVDEMTPEQESDKPEQSLSDPKISGITNTSVSSNASGTPNTVQAAPAPEVDIAGNGTEELQNSDSSVKDE